MEIIFALAITLAIEVNLYMILDYKNLKLFVVVSIINIITNSSMNLILLTIRSDFYYYLILSIFDLRTRRPRIWRTYSPVTRWCPEWPPSRQ